MTSPSDGETTASLRDAANRFERTLDYQIQLINDIDNKAEHVTRLIGVLIGALLSVLAVAIRINGGSVPPPRPPIYLSFMTGIGLLLAAMAFSIVTYLSSKFKIGLHYRPAQLLSQHQYHVDELTHIRRVVGTYGYNLEKNKAVIDVNARRFRYSLVTLLGGVVWLSMAGIMFVSAVDERSGWIFVAITAIGVLAVSWYILAGKYLTLDDQT